MRSSDEITAAELRAPFDAVTPFTVGLEEEAMLLDPVTLDLAPCADEVLARLDGDGRYTRELPAAQLELVTRPADTVAEAIALLADGRRDLVARTEATARPAAAGVHPFAAAEGVLNEGERYARTVARHGPVARRQLVAALQVHVAVGGSERTIAVHDALRCFLPELAALAANAPFHDGRDTGMASVRPLISQQLPRQGIPPALGSWDALAEELEWGRRSGTVPERGVWWWELRPHLSHGTLELRVPDAQTTIADAAGVAVVAQALVAWLAERHDRGEELPAAADWRIAENRWSALRSGVEGEMADLRSGVPGPTRDRLRRLLDELEPVAERLGSASLLEHAHALVRENGALRQRAVAGDATDLRGVTGWLADRYPEPLPA